MPSGARHRAQRAVTEYGWEIRVAPRSNKPAIINGRHYSGHALDKMQGRGVVPSVVEDSILLGRPTIGSDGRVIYYSVEDNVSVIVGAEGRVITAIPGKAASR